MAANPLGIEVDSNSDNCMICLESLSSEQQYTLPECSHTFHQNCIMHWFRSGSHKCPLCNNLGINDNSNSNTHNNSSTRWGWWRGGQQRYQMIRKYSRKKDAPQMLKKEVEKLKKLETKHKALTKEIKDFKNKVGPFGELKREWGKFRSKRWRLDASIRKRKMSISNFNIVQVIIAKKVNVHN